MGTITMDSDHKLLEKIWIELLRLNGEVNGIRGEMNQIREDVGEVRETVLLLAESVRLIRNWCTSLDARVSTLEQRNGKG